MSQLILNWQLEFSHCESIYTMESGQTIKIRAFPPRESTVKYLPAHHWINPLFSCRMVQFINTQTFTVICQLFFLSFFSISHPLIQIKSLNILRFTLVPIAKGLKCKYEVFQYVAVYL